MCVRSQALRNPFPITLQGYMTEVSSSILLSASPLYFHFFYFSFRLHSPEAEHVLRVMFSQS